jgi:hypothetical protein
MVLIRPALRISGFAQGSSELSYRQVAARDYPLSFLTGKLPVVTIESQRGSTVIPSR